MNPRSRRTASSTSSNRSAPKGAGAPSLRALSGYRLTEALIAGWRPLQRLDVGGFALLRSRGITRRANSAVAVDAPTAEDALLDAVTKVEGLSAMTGETPCFRVLDIHGPAQLDTLLEARGYEIVGASELLELPLGRALRAAPHPSAEISTGTLEEGWFESAWSLAPRDGENARQTLHDILAGTPAVQVQLRAPGADGQSPGQTVAVGRAALVEAGKESAAVLNMIAVHPEHRRRGLGRAVSETLLAIAAVQGASRALLEVERDNTGAAALYRGLGFAHLGEYHYRVGAAPGDRA